MEECNGTFQLKFVSLNKQKGSGGDIIELTKAFRVQKSAVALKRDGIINVKQKDNADHPHYVHIDLITEFNHEKVYL